jgi:hypothetical protein
MPGLGLKGTSAHLKRRIVETGGVDSHIEAHIYNYIIMFMHYIMHIRFTCSHKFNIYYLQQVIHQKSFNASRRRERPLDHTWRTTSSKSGYP